MLFLERALQANEQQSKRKRCVVRRKPLEGLESDHQGIGREVEGL